MTRNCLFGQFSTHVRCDLGFERLKTRDFKPDISKNRNHTSEGVGGALFRPMLCLCYSYIRTRSISPWACSTFLSFTHLSPLDSTLITRHEDVSVLRPLGHARSSISSPKSNLPTRSYETATPPNSQNTKSSSHTSRYYSQSKLTSSSSS